MNRWRPNAQGSPQSNAPSPSSSGSGSARRAGVSDLVEVAETALRALRSLADPADRAELVTLEQALHRAVLADEVRAVADRLQRLRSTRLLVEVAGGPAASPALLQGILGAACRVAESVRAHEAATVLSREMTSPVLATAPERAATSAVSALDEVASVGARLVERREALERCLAALMATLARCSAAEGETIVSAQRLCDRIRETTELDELHLLQTALLDQAEALVEVARERDAQARSARAEVERSLTRIQQLETRLQEITDVASTDPLTLLANRRALGQTIASWNGSGPVGVLAIDVDHFKNINDRHGHAGGDVVLRHIAGLIRSELRTDDRAFRVGGEELVVLLPRSDWAGARATAHRLHARVGQDEVPLRSGRARVTVSIGIAMWSSEEPFEAAAERADMALYRAKSAGRDRVVG